MAWRKRFMVSGCLIAYVMLAMCILTLADVRAEDEIVGSLQDARNHTREEFVHGMAETTLAILQDQKQPFVERKGILRRAFGTVMDIDWIAKFVIGRAWNTATNSQKASYTDLYRTFLTESYVSNFAENPDKRIRDIKILGIQDGEDNDFIVTTIMYLADMEELKVGYRVSDHEGKYKVIDIIIENVSLLATHRTQFSEIATTEGMDAVIAKLKALNERYVLNAMNTPAQ